MPSLVSDWTIPIDPIPFVAYPIPFHAAGGLHLHARLSDNKDVLIFRGKLLDTVDLAAELFYGNAGVNNTVVGNTVSDPLLPISANAAFLHQNIPWLRECHVVAFGETRETSSEFCETVFMQNFHEP